jgi:hypothetical protein
VGSEPTPDRDLDLPDTAARPPRRSPFARIAFLVFGAGVAVYLGSQGPKEQHVRVVLGSAAPDVTEVSLRYVAADGEVARVTRFAYDAGSAPRVVAHEPQLPSGDYRLEIEVGRTPRAADEGDSRKAIQRQVTLGGGSTQIDISNALVREDKR